MEPILFIDTSSDNAQFLLSNQGKYMDQYVHSGAMNQAAIINIGIETLLSENSITLRDLSAIAVIAGPGSYTGLRVGLSSAKGYCFALDIPLIMLNKLDILARIFKTEEHQLVTLKARENEYFAASFKQSSYSILQPAHYFLEDLITKKEVFLNYQLIGNIPIPELNFLSETLLPDNYLLDENICAAIIYEHYKAKQFADLAYATPIYLKAAFTTQRKKNIL